jgi:hypothetical protein
MPGQKREARLRLVVPGIHFWMQQSKTWMAGTSPDMTECRGSRNHTADRLIIFVDRIFTTSLQRSFTNAFDASAQNIGLSCVYRARNAD